MRKTISACALILGGLAANGCAPDSPLYMGGGGGGGLGLGCPTVAFLSELTEMSRFEEGSNRTLNDLVYRAKFTRMERSCEVEDEQVYVDLSLTLDVDRGPANKEGVANVDFFVALLEPDDSVKLRQVFKHRVEFDERGTNLQFEVPFGVEFTAGDIPAGQHRIYVGLEMTRDELEYNRRRRATR